MLLLDQSGETDTNTSQFLTKLSTTFICSSQKQYSLAIDTLSAFWAAKTFTVTVLCNFGH